MVEPGCRTASAAAVLAARRPLALRAAPWCLLRLVGTCCEVT
ncbi:hypothetical protein [Actinomyces faecalis]|nr:hypothetical protein [Actinomyces faecalis]